MFSTNASRKKELREVKRSLEKGREGTRRKEGGRAGKRG
jgi:hypothetical protein